MKEMTRLAEFRQATEAARQNGATPPSQPAPGELYLFPGEGDLATRWAVLAVHPDRPELLLAVPVDGQPLFGLADVALRESGRRLTLRCGLGLWLPRHAFASNRRLPPLSAEGLQSARAKMLQVVRGAADGPEAARESEANPDFQEWMAQVAAAVERLATATRSAPVALSPADFQPTLPFGRSSEPQAAPLVLAAAGTEPAAPAPTASAQLARRVELAHPGATWLVLQSAGVAVLFQSETGATPVPVAQADATGAWRPLTWIATPGGQGAKVVAPWVGASVRLRFGSDETAPEITVSRS